MNRLFFYAIPLAAILILLTPSLHADPPGPVLIDFEDLDPNSEYSNGSVFTSSIATITLSHQIEFPGDNDPNEYVYISENVFAGGSGIEIGEIRNLNLGFDFGTSFDTIEFKYYDAGGNLNLEINGQMLNFNKFEQINGQTLGGTLVSVVLNDPNQGQVEISGRVYSFKIGGTSLWIDDMTVSGFGPTTFCVDTAGNDLDIGLSKDTAFATIQNAINIANDGDTVHVYPGTYQESVIFLGKSITVMGIEQPPVIQSPGQTAVDFHQDETGNSILMNFIITGSNTGISCPAGSPVIRNVTVVDNVFGVTSYEGAAPDISNCIFWGNKDGDISGCVVNYSCSAELAEGIGNIAVDPMFVRMGYFDDNSTPTDPNDDYYVPGDYHLKSAGWRWSEIALHGSNWYYDNVTSRCIDAGNPSYTLSDEPLFVDVDPLNEWGFNLRVNMGAYGSTQWASMPPYEHSLLPDINNDGIVNGNDLVYLAYHWLETDPCQIGDISRDAIVDLRDFSLFGSDWLKITSWGNNLDLKDYWPFNIPSVWASQVQEPNSFSYQITETFEKNGVDIWHFSNQYVTGGGTVMEDEYCFYIGGDLYSTNDSNDLDNLPGNPQLFQKRFPGVIVPDVPFEISGSGVLYPVRGSLSSLLQNSQYTLDDFPMGDNYDVIAFFADYGFPTERIVIILGRGFGPLLIGSDYTDELIVADPLQLMLLQ
ncbi:MAG: hypothetical protein FVQ82_01810 [Planctomycetes bacterium]|nr:hypothetical protein [Planctomycetota bacterium]